MDPNDFAKGNASTVCPSITAVIRTCFPTTVVSEWESIPSRQPFLNSSEVNSDCRIGFLLALDRYIILVTRINRFSRVLG